MPYNIALTKASASPIATWPWDLCGKEPRFLSLSPDRSTPEIRTMPAREARTPMNFLSVNLSTLSRAPNTKVQTPVGVSFNQVCQARNGFLLLVEVSIVELATVVYSRQAAVP